MKKLILPLILLGVAISIAVGAYFFLVYLQKPRAGEVIVANRDIQTGAIIKESMITSIPWQGKKFPEGFISVKDKKRCLGRVASVDIVRGAPITHRCLAPAGSPAGLYAKIPKGMRALTVKVDEISSVAGFSRPGSRVDVLLATNREGPEGEKKGSKIILQNVLVLAAGQSITQLEGQNKPKVVRTVTLLLTPEEAEKLALATKMGSLLLTLRAGNDNDPVVTVGSVPDDVWGERTPTVEMPFTVIEVIQGGQKKRVRFSEKQSDETAPGSAPKEVEDVVAEEKKDQPERERITVVKKG